MNTGMWLKALKVIPRIDKAEWDKLDIISRWLISTRAAVLIMTFISAALAGIFAWRDGNFHLGRWVLLMVGLVFAHATNNLINDLTDHKRGVDKDNYFRTKYGPQPLEQGLMLRTAKHPLAPDQGVCAGNVERVVNQVNLGAHDGWLPECRMPVMYALDLDSEPRTHHGFSGNSGRHA